MIYTLIFYSAVIIAVTLYSKFKFKSNFFHAGHDIGPVVLLLTLFATNMTAISIIGAPDKSFSGGFNVFITLGCATALIVPFLFKILGTQVCEQSKSTGFVTQPELVYLKTGSSLCRYIFMILCLCFLVPYIIVGLKGGGEIASVFFEEYGMTVDAKVTTGLVALLIYVYVIIGGIRGTSLINSVQAFIFIFGSIYIFSFLIQKNGGITDTISKLVLIKPDVFNIESRPGIMEIVSFYIITFSVGAFPHIFNHWCTAKSAKTFNSTLILYPVCVVLLWISCVSIGIVANLELSEQPDSPIIIALISVLDQEWVSGIIAISILAAIMSSLDSQLISVGALVSKNMTRYSLSHEWILLIFLVACYLISIFSDQSIFQLGIWSLIGFSSLTPILYVCLTQEKVESKLMTIALLSLLFAWVTLLLLDQGVASAIVLFALSLTFSGWLKYKHNRVLKQGMEVCA
ncbi:hypothetical protein MHO82_10835 [Vibrio sp. Of7-15]|uniref:sodium:solute symporter family protein n=1 Tax=Vibrio sp. Of7-15 TaxID=2724879 RepID=UPI001EF20DE0|nr:hypothetical protein [Vibrio sp. Of7-15]MCG7497360.1 hypothetical protein [Vibrio sp. Of7-15]